MQDEFPLIDGIVHHILMHRDSHFGGSFEAMIAYYEKEGKGVQQDISMKNLKDLERMEKELGRNLSVDILLEEEKKEVELARHLYHQLRDLYELDERNQGARLLADLILSEEEEPTAEIAAVVALGSKVVPSLLQILRSEKLYDPLFPGYGEAPRLAARCLGLIGDERAIRPLFEALNHEDFFMEEVIYSSLATLGEAAQQFLLNRLISQPLSKENEQAVIALLSFKPHPTIARTCLDMLERGVIYTPSTLTLYLIMGCHGLTDQDRRRFLTLSQRADLPHDLKLEMDTVIKSWNNLI